MQPLNKAIYLFIITLLFAACNEDSPEFIPLSEELSIKKGPDISLFQNTESSEWMELLEITSVFTNDATEGYTLLNVEEVYYLFGHEDTLNIYTDEYFAPLWKDTSQFKNNIFHPDMIDSAGQLYLADFWKYGYYYSYQSKSRKEAYQSNSNYRIKRDSIIQMKYLHEDSRRLKSDINKNYLAHGPNVYGESAYYLYGLVDNQIIEISSREKLVDIMVPFDTPEKVYFLLKWKQRNQRMSNFRIAQEINFFKVEVSFSDSYYDLTLPDIENYQFHVYPDGKIDTVRYQVEQRE